MTDAHRYPDYLFEEQAAYLADHTDATAKQAEAFLRWYLANDDDVGRTLGGEATANRELAKRMGISESMYSKHLKKAKQRLHEDEAAFDAFHTMLALTDIGGPTGLTHRVIGADSTQSAFVFVTADGFDTGERLATRYKAHLIYREPGSAHIGEDAPDDIIHYDKWTTFTVKAETDDQLARSLAYYMDTIDALDAMDVVGVFDLLDDLDEFNVDVEEYTDAVQEVIRNTIGASGDTDS